MTTITRITDTKYGITATYDCATITVRLYPMRHGREADGNSREIEVRRFVHSDGATGGWYSHHAIAHVRHRTGTKLYPVDVHFTNDEIEAGEAAIMNRRVTVRNRHAYVVGWVEDYAQYRARYYSETFNPQA